MKLLTIALMLISCVAFAKPSLVVTEKATAQDFTDAWVDIGSPIDTSGYDGLGVAFSYTVNSSENLQIRAVGLLTKTGTVDYQFPLVSIESAVIALAVESFKLPTPAVPLLLQLDIGDNGNTPWTQLQIKAETVGATPATMDIITSIRRQAVE